MDTMVLKLLQLYMSLVKRFTFNRPLNGFKLCFSSISSVSYDCYKLELELFLNLFYTHISITPEHESLVSSHSYLNYKLQLFIFLFSVKTFAYCFDSSCIYRVSSEFSEDSEHDQCKIRAYGEKRDRFH